MIHSIGKQTPQGCCLPGGAWEVLLPHIPLNSSKAPENRFALNTTPCLLLTGLVNYYLSLGGSLLDLDETCFCSGPTACCEDSTPLLLSGCALGGAVSWEEAAAVLRGVWDRDRSWSRAFFSLGTSEPAPVAVSLRVPSWLGCWGPLPKNHAPDLVKISCCFRHKLHTHITYLKKREQYKFSMPFGNDISLSH